MGALSHPFFDRPKGAFMGFFDDLKRAVSNSIKREAGKAVSDALSEIGKGKNREESFVFGSLPQNLQELQSLPEASLDSAFKTAALAVAVLCRYGKSADDAIEMLNFLKGPEEVSGYEKQFYKERLSGKDYIPFSYFDGTSPDNGYTPSVPFTLSVFETPYSFDNENWATLWVKSSGADNMRSIKLRKKPSTGQWFINDIQCLSEIRLPMAEDKWA